MNAKERVFDASYNMTSLSCNDSVEDLKQMVLLCRKFSSIIDAHLNDFITENLWQKTTEQRELLATMLPLLPIPDSSVAPMAPLITPPDLLMSPSQPSKTPQEPLITRQEPPIKSLNPSIISTDRGAIETRLHLEKTLVPDLTSCCFSYGRECCEFCMNKKNSKGATISSNGNTFLPEKKEHEVQALSTILKEISNRLNCNKV